MIIRPVTCFCVIWPLRKETKNYVNLLSQKIIISFSPDWSRPAMAAAILKARFQINCYKLPANYICAKFHFNV